MGFVDECEDQAKRRVKGDSGVYTVCEYTENGAIDLEVNPGASGTLAQRWMRLGRAGLGSP